MIKTQSQNNEIRQIRKVWNKAKGEVGREVGGGVWWKAWYKVGRKLFL
jgi:hypothetical protein